MKLIGTNNVAFSEKNFDFYYDSWSRLYSSFQLCEPQNREVILFQKQKRKSHSCEVKFEERGMTRQTPP